MSFKRFLQEQKVDRVHWSREADYHLNRAAAHSNAAKLCRTQGHADLAELHTEAARHHARLHMLTKQMAEQGHRYANIKGTI